MKHLKSYSTSNSKDKLLYKNFKLDNGCFRVFRPTGKLISKVLKKRPGPNVRFTSRPIGVISKLDKV